MEITEYRPVLDPQWAPPPCTLPDALRELIDMLYPIHSLLPGGIIAQRLGTALQRHGMNVQGVRRGVSCSRYQSTLPSEHTHLVLGGLEIAGAIHGLRGGQGWDEIFDIERNNYANMHWPWMREGKLQCRWEAPRYDDLGAARDEPWDGLIEKFLVEHRAKVLQKTTPSLKGQRTKTRL